MAEEEMVSVEDQYARLREHRGIEVLRRMLAIDESVALQPTIRSMRDPEVARVCAAALRDALAAFDNLTSVQARCTELIEENRRLRVELAAQIELLERVGDAC